MRPIELVLAHPLAARIGWALIYSLWEGLLIAAGIGVGVLALRVRSSNVRYLAYCAGLALVLLAPLVTVAFIDIPVDVPAYKALAPAVSVAERPPTVSVGALQTTVPFRERATAAAEAARRRAEPQRAREVWLRAKNWVSRRASLIAVLWTAGVLCLSCRNIVGCWCVHRLKRHDVSVVPEGVAALCRRACERLGVRVRVRLALSSRVETPVLIGWFRPLVLLPASVVTGIPAAHLEPILYHELAHIRRWDYLVNLVQVGIETLLFYHPAAWWLSARIRTERERACDDMAVTACGDRVRYAEALVQIEALRVRRLQMVLSAGGDLLVDRIRRLAGWDAFAPGRALAGLAGAVAVAVVLGQLSVAIAQTTNVLPERTVYFPENRSLGQVEIRPTAPWQVQWFSARVGPQAARSAEAMGAVHVPAGHDVYLTVSESGASDLSPLAYLRSDDLQGINLWDLPIRDDDLQYLAGMTSLRLVMLGNTNISDEGLSYLEGMNTIQDLNLRLTRVTDAGLEHLRGMTDMRDLSLNGTTVTDAGMEALSGMTQMQYLDLWQTGVSDEGMSYLSNMAQMRDLGLEDTEITDAGLAYLANMPLLTSLNLENNTITDAGLRYLTALEKLTGLNIADTLVTDEGMAILARLQSLRSLTLPLQIGPEALNLFRDHPNLGSGGLHATTGKRDFNNPGQPFTIRVVDAVSGMPGPGVSVELGYGDDVHFFVTGEDGTVTCYLPEARGKEKPVDEKYRIVVRPEKLIPVEVELELPFPEEITVRLEHGQVIGGTVVDETGQPIEKVSVAFPIPGAPNWNGPETLDYTVVSDAQGRWRCDVAPADLSTFWIRLNHPLHAQTVYNADTLSVEALKNQSQVLVMGPGLTLSGRVVNSSRQVIEGARVTQYARQTRRPRLYCFEPTPKSAVTGVEGHFDLGNCDPGTMTLVVEAVGYRTEAFDVEIEAGMPAVEFILGSLGVLKGMVVDPEERPLAGVTITMREKEREGLPVADYHGTSDAQGRFEYLEAPIEPLEYSFFTRGFQPLTASLAPTPYVQRITLKPVEQFGAAGPEVLLAAEQQTPVREEATAQAGPQDAQGLQKDAGAAHVGGAQAAKAPRNGLFPWPWALILLPILAGALYFFTRSRR